MRYGISIIFLRGNSDKTSADEEPKALEVKLTGPETAAPHEKTEYKAEVFTAASVSRMRMKSCLKYGKKEKRRRQNKQGQGGKRAYHLRTEFDEEGVYTVQSHVTANQRHNMPTVKVRVGDAEGADDSSGHEEQTHHH